MTLLTVAIPTLNGEKYIEDAVSSVLSQIADGVDVELLIVENASTDNTPEVCRRIAQEHSSVRVIHNNHTLSFDQNVAKAVQHSTGDYVWILADDDVIAPGALKIVQESLSGSNPSVLLVNFRKVDENLRDLVPQDSANLKTANSVLQESHIFLKPEEALLGAGFEIFGLLSAIVVRRETYVEYSSNVDFGLPEGFDFLYIIPRLMQRGKTVFIDRDFVLFRQYKKRWEVSDDYSQSMIIFFTVIPKILNELARGGFEKEVINALLRRHLANLTFQLMKASKQGMRYRGNFLMRVVRVNYQNPIFWIQIPIFFLPSCVVQRLTFIYEGKLADSLRRLIGA